MKRTIIPALAGIATLSLLTACGAASSPDSDSEPPAASNSPTTPGSSDNATDSDAEPGSDASGKLVVWNWGDSETASPSYQETVLADFAAKYPNVEVEIVPQPFDNYYTLLGTAIQSNSGPDLVLFNGGAQLTSRVDALVPLDDLISEADKSRIAGWEAFSADGKIYAVPNTLQGLPLYYNKAVYEAAGLDPEIPPKTWADLENVCAAIKSSDQDATCFALGNKEQLGIEFFLTGFGPGIFSETEYQDWLAGKRDWNSPNVRKVFELWKSTYDDGWYNEGVNSTAMFMDEFDLFNGGKAGNVIGLTSGTANFTQFAEFLGNDVGVFLPPIVNEEVPNTFLPIEGGIGYGVTKWSTNPELAAELALSYASNAASTVYTNESGSLSADTTVKAETDIQAGLDIISWLPEGRPLLHTALPADTLDLLHRVATNILTGETSIDDAINQLAEIDK